MTQTSKRLPSPEELLGTGAGAKEETDRLLELWRARGWKIEPLEGEGAGRNGVRVNGKAVMTRYSGYADRTERGSNTFYGITPANVELLDHTGGFLVCVVERAEFAFVIPVSRVSSHLHKANLIGGSYKFKIDRVRASGRWRFDSSGGDPIDVTDCYDAVEFLEP